MPSEMTPERAAKLLDDATPPPWHASRHGSWFRVDAGLDRLGAILAEPASGADADLIAAAPDLARAYLDEHVEVMRLRRIIARAEAAAIDDDVVAVLDATARVRLGVRGD